MNCHLLEIEKIKTPVDLIWSLNTINEVFERSGHFSIEIQRCKYCGQPFVKVYAEITYIHTGRSDDDSWVYFVPIEENEIDELKDSKDKCLKLFEERKHITIDCEDKMYWNTNSINWIMQYV